MIIGFKDGVKLFGISIVVFCAVFVCTFFLNFYIDAQAIADVVAPELQPLYDAQILTAEFTCIITGACLCLTAIVMLVFYIKLFVDGNAKLFGVLKSLGYSDTRIAASFWVFGTSVFIGAALGYACGHAVMPLIYDQMSMAQLPKIEIRYHVELLFALVFAPTAAFALSACGYAKIALRRSPNALLKSSLKSKPSKIGVSDKDRPFLADMSTATLKSKKSVVFFIAFAGFCFSAMVQMSVSMVDLSSVTMGTMILSIGIILAVVTLIMAVTAVINGNVKNIAVMKAFGYSAKERALCLLVGYVPFAFLGFAVGTVYQYGLLKIMTGIIFGGVAEVPEYAFDVPVFLITLLAFCAAYFFAMFVFSLKINKVSVKIAMAEE